MKRLFLYGLIPLSAFAQEAPVSYEKEIAPIFRAYCAGCHNDKDQEAKLSLETYAQLRRGGEDHGDPIKPGSPAESYLIQITNPDAKRHMPPKDEPQVPASERATLQRWVAAGAPGPRADGSILQSLKVPTITPAIGAKPITAAAYSADGNQLALGRTGSVELREVTQDKVRLTISDIPGKVSAVHFTADGKQLLVATGIPGLHGVAQLRDTATGAVVREFGGHRDLLADAEISPDGLLLATAGYDRNIRLWQWQDGKFLRSIDIHKGAIFDLAWSPDSSVLASASADETVKLWRVTDGVRLDTLNQPQAELCAVSFSADGQRILAAGRDRRIYAWEFTTRKTPGLNPVLIARFAHEAPIVSMTTNAAGTMLLSAAEDRSLKLWSLPDLILQHAYDAQSDIAAVMLGSPDGNFLVARMDGSMGNIIPASGAASGSAPAPAHPAAVVATAAALSKFQEVEPNHDETNATPITWPAEITGAISAAGDEDRFRFHALAGAALTIEVNAARAKSKLDSRVEILHADGRPVEQVVLQATRDSWFTFRGKNSDTSDDFRLHNWAEMELNEYLYANGEVVKLWLYPRGPDSGYKVYPGAGNRQPCFGTPALAHALGEPAYIVTPLPPGSQPAPTGLPVFRLNYVNDDESTRRLGADSQLLFTAPAEGDYLVKLTDVRGLGGEQDFHYTLIVRPQQPDFSVSVGGKDPKISPGSGREITFNALRNEGFTGPIRIDLSHLPPGFTASTPVEIEAEQHTAQVVINASADASAPDPAAMEAIKITATALINGHEVMHDAGSLGKLQLGPPAKVLVEIIPGSNLAFVPATPEAPLQFNIHPGETISAKVRATRNDFAGRIELGKEDAGRNLPFGIFVDNIGLSGLLIVEGQTERDFVITASKVAQPGTRLFYLQTNADGGQATRPVRIQVLPRVTTAGRGR